MAYPTRVLGLALLFAGSMAFAQTATISGTVVDDSGVAVAGTKVYYKNAPTTVRDRAGHTSVTGPVVSSSVATGKDGSFSVTGLPAGVYWLCAEVLQQGQQIRSCDWGFGSTKVDLTTATSADNVKLQVHGGVTLTFLVNDARSQIKDFAAGVMGMPSVVGNFRILVVNGTWLRPAQLVSVSGSMHKYAVTVPATRSLRILLDTKLNVLNQKNTAMAPGKLDDTITVSGQPMNYTLTVP
jgi:hypothetical protein